MATGWEKHYREHFGDIVAEYDDVRPEYPQILYSDIIKYVGKNNDKIAIEIGAGTGKATASFLDAGYDITAVEISGNMAEFLKNKFIGYNNFNVITASFEQAALQDEGYNLIYAATAFHWVDAAIGCPKAYKLLKPGGVFAVFRNNAAPADGEPLYEEIQNVYAKYYHKPYMRPEKISNEDYNSPSEIYRGFRFYGLSAYGFSDVTMKLYNSTRTFGADEYLLLLDTFSDHRILPAGDKSALYAGVRDAIIKNGGHLSINYVFQLYMGRKL